MKSILYRLSIQIGFLLSYGGPAVHARSFARSDYSHELLYPRQDTDDTSNYCAPACLYPSCANNACSNPADAKRWLITAENASAQHDLEKRVFKIDPQSNTPQLGPYTLAQIRNYLVQQWATDGVYDRQYGQIDHFLHLENNVGDERAVSKTRAFADAQQPFQFFSAGLHGCTQVVVVSNRGVWMAHFWEAYSNGFPVKDALKTSASNKQFNERVLAHLSGTKVDPARADPGYFAKPYREDDNGIHPYLTPDGEPFKPDLFNQEGDNTQVFIMAPAAPGTLSTTPDRDRKWMAPTRIDAIIRTIGRSLGVRANGLQIVKYPYIRLETDDQGNVVGQHQSERGFALFQYDPHSDGANRKAWRLFLEGTPYSSAIP